MSRRRTRLTAGACALVATVTLAACADRATPASKPGTALLAAATRYGRASDAVSFSVRTGTPEETFVRRGADSIVIGAYGDSGANEVRRVGGVVYARADLDLPTGQEAPWIRIDPGADQSTWLAALGDDLTAPTPAQATSLLTSNVARVSGLRTGAGGRRTLAISAKFVRNGERPTSISVAPGEPAIVGRVVTLYADDRRVVRRTYSGARWRDGVEAITAPEGAVSVEGVRDPQAGALPAEVLRAPGALPAGWVLRGVVGITPPQGDGTCQQALTMYGPAGQPLSAGYLAVYLKPSGCQTPAAPGAAKFIAGSNTGWVGSNGDATIGGLTVGGVSVRFRSSLPAAELSSVLARWTPFTPG